MENICLHNGIMYGYTGYGNDKRIMAFQDGDSKTSLANSGFNEDERVIKFVEYRGDLYALATDGSLGRILRLDRQVTGSVDEWVEVIGVTDLDEGMADMVCFGSGIYIVGSNSVWSLYNDVLTAIDTLPANFVCYSICYADDYLFLYGKMTDYGIGYQSIQKYKDTFEEIDSSNTIIDFTSIMIPEGKKLICEYKGKLYYNLIRGSSGQLVSYDASTLFRKDEFEMFDFEHDIPTCVIHNNDMILVAIHNTLYDAANTRVFVPKRFAIEGSLIAGDGDVSDNLKRVPSDPLVSDSGLTNTVLPAFDEIPLVGSLKGTSNQSFKLAHRMEAYSDVQDVSSLASLSLKEIMDQLCNVNGCVFFMDGMNKATIQMRSIVGVPDKFIDIKQSTDYGDNLIKEVGNTTSYPNSFIKITVSWDNMLWDSNNPIQVGALTAEGNNLDISSDFINDPLTASNVAINLLKQMANVEQLEMVLVYSHFLENGDVVSFNVDRDFIYMDKNREYKLYSVEHDYKSKLTKLVVVERILVSLVDNI